jgi:hypothetical protein
MRIWHRVYRKSFIGVLALCVVGCGVRPITFEVIDVDTQKPLSGVVVEQESASMDMLFPGGNDVSLPATDGRGVVTHLIDVGTYNYIFTFRANGYLDSAAYAYRDYGDAGIKVMAPRVLPPVDGPMPLELSTSMKSAHGVFKVPMYRVGSPSTKP